MQTIEKVQESILILEAQQEEDTTQYNNLMFKSIENRANRVNTSTARVVQDQITTLEADIKGRANQLKYLKNYLKNHLPSTSNISSIIIPEDAQSNHSNITTIVLYRPSIVPQNLPKYGNSYEG